jgi:exodeoxyribonuclease VII large subunit
MNTDRLENTLSVLGLTEYIQLLLEGDRQLQRVWVTGEVSSLHEHPRGLFFTLCDPDGEAAIQCVVWNSGRSKLSWEPKRGEQIIALGNVKLYNKRGEYKLTVFQCLPAGEGLQQLRYQQLRARLQAEGLFDEERKRSLPTHPRTIAVVTSPTAAAWGDIQRTLWQRYPGLTVLLSPATVQGIEAPDSIVQAIARVNEDNRAEVIILARGGGAVEDLACFNDEKVVRAIVTSKIPVIAGIGHQRDESLADLVADYSAHTPTAAAEIAVPSLERLIAEHEYRLSRLVESVRGRFDREVDRLAGLRQRLSSFPHDSRQLLQATGRVELLKQKLKALDPHAVLQRGYAVVREEDGRIVRSSEELAIDRVLFLQLGTGIVKVKVIDDGNSRGEI